MDYNYSYIALIPNPPTESPSADELAKLSKFPRRKAKSAEGWCSIKLLYGCILVILISFSWVAATQFAQSTYSTTFNAPFFVTWFCTSWLVCCYPLYWLFNFISAKCQNRDYRPAIDTAWKVFGRDQVNIPTAILRSCCFGLMWVVTNYMHIFALGIIAASDVSALFSSNTAFVFFFSWTILHERFEGTKLFASIFSLAGVIIMSYVDGFLWANPALTGILSAVGAAVGSAMYKVLFKRLIGETNYGQLSLLLTGIGITNIVLFWPVLLAFYMTKTEIWTIESIPWALMAATAVSFFAFHCLENYGPSVAHPLFITLGVVTGLPLNALVDFFVRRVYFRPIEITGLVLISVGFFLTLLPANWTQEMRKHLPCASLRKDPDEEALKHHYVHTPRDLLRMSMAAAKKKQMQAGA